MKVIELNPQDKVWRHSEFLISVHNYDNEVFSVHADSTQKALDYLVDHLESEEMMGPLYTIEEWEEQFGDVNDYQPIVAGNSCYYLDPEHVQIVDRRFN